MIYTEALDHMTKNDLKNLVYEYNTLNEDLLYFKQIQDNLIIAYEQLIHSQKEVATKEILFRDRLERIEKIETDLNHKYEDYIKKPCCECNELEDDNL